MTRYWIDMARTATQCCVLLACATSAWGAPPAGTGQPWTSAMQPGPGTTAAALPVAATGRVYVLPPDPGLSGIPGKILPPRQRPYSLAQLINVAESINPTTRAAWNDARRTALGVGMAKSAYLPHLAVTALAGRNNVESRGGGLGTDVHGTGNAEFVSLQWLLFDFGERSALVAAARQTSLSSRITFTAANQKVVHDVSVAFYAYQAARAHVDTATSSLADARKIQDAAEHRRDRGVATVMEVAQARQATAQAKLALVTSKGEQQNAYQDLLAAVGVSPLTQIRIADLASRELPKADSAPIEAVIRDALARRPDVRIADAGVKVAHAKVRAAKAAFLPKVFLYANEGHYSNNLGVSASPVLGQGLPTVDFGGHGWAGGVFLGVRIPLYDGGLRAAQTGQARIAVTNARTHLEQVQQAAVRQIVRGSNNLRSSLEAWHAAMALQAASQTSFDAALAAYHHGVGTITALNAAEIQLNVARNAVSDAHSAALSAAATLALARGTAGSQAYLP